ncbi:MAG: RNA 3'-terminal phosphate cyclase [Candidatus Thorarchaeota archaeon]|jgi:RNA 3'-phosphate cyclase
MTLKMIEIDGSYGEGGGQILRTSVSLSALTLEPVRVTNIRAGRPNPGLRRQHIAGIDLTARLVNAEVKGLNVGSEKIEFIPKQRRGGEFAYDVGTAGSVSLVLQAALPPALLSPEPVHFKLRGGTDVSWSPPVDYMSNVFSHMLGKMGASIQLTQKKRGHYPKGGGEVTCIVEPMERITPLTLTNFGKIDSVEGISHCVRLPAHVAERQASSAEEVLREKGLGIIDIKREYYPKNSDPHFGPGSGIVLWAESDNGVRVGSDNLGAKGKRAEDVGTEAAYSLLSEISPDKAIDSHLSDMLVPYLALATGNSKIGISKVTSHLETNIWAARRILDADMKLEGRIGESGLLTVKGIEFSR